MHLSELLGQWKWNVGLGKTFNLSYHLINSDYKSQSYANLMVFNKMATKLRWPPKMLRKYNTALDLNMPHLVWKFMKKSCFGFSDMAIHLKKGTKGAKTLKDFTKIAVNLRWPPGSAIKSTHSLVHHMFHLVWMFHEESSFSFWELVRQLKKVDKKKKIIIAKKEFQGNQEFSPLLRWSLIILKHTHNLLSTSKHTYSSYNIQWTKLIYQSQSAVTKGVELLFTWSARVAYCYWIFTRRLIQQIMIGCKNTKG